MPTFYTPLNRARALLTQTHVIGDGQFIVDDGSVFGNPSATNPVKVTATVGGVDAHFSITSRTGNTLIIDGMLEGTADVGLPSDSAIEVRVTAKDLSDIHRVIVDPTEITVKQYGAQGDGSTDDTAAIQAALDAAVSLKYSVYVPPGTYIVTTVDVPDGIRLFGNRDGSIIKRKAATNASIITLASRSILETLTLDGNAAGQTGSPGVGVSMVQAIDFESSAAVLDCSFINCWSVAIFAYDHADFKISGCSTSSNPHGCVYIDHQSHRPLIVNNHFWNCTGPGIAIHAADAPVAESPVYLESPIVKDNIIDYRGVSTPAVTLAIELFGTANTGTFDVSGGCVGGEVSGNQIFGSDQGGTQVIFGISIGGCTGTYASGNTIIGGALHSVSPALECAMSDGCTLMGNYVEGPGLGLSISQNTKDNTIIANTFKDCTSSAISVSANCTGLKITANTFEDCGTNFIFMGVSTAGTYIEETLIENNHFRITSNTTSASVGLYLFDSVGGITGTVFAHNIGSPIPGGAGTYGLRMTEANGGGFRFVEGNYWDCTSPSGAVGQDWGSVFHAISTPGVIFRNNIIKNASTGAVGDLVTSGVPNIYTGNRVLSGGGFVFYRTTNIAYDNVPSTSDTGNPENFILGGNLTVKGNIAGPANQYIGWGDQRINIFPSTATLLTIIDANIYGTSDCFFQAWPGANGYGFFENWGGLGMVLSGSGSQGLQLAVGRVSKLKIQPTGEVIVASLDTDLTPPTTTGTTQMVICDASGVLSFASPTATVVGGTSGRIPFETTGGVLTDSADLTYSGSALEIRSGNALRLYRPDNGYSRTITCDASNRISMDSDLIISGYIQLGNPMLSGDGFTVQSSTGTPVILKASVNNAGQASASVIVDTTPGAVATISPLLSIRNNAIEKAYFNANGRLSIVGLSSTSTARDVAYVDAGFNTSTDASRTGYGCLDAVGFNGREYGLRVDATGTGANVGLFGSGSAGSYGGGVGCMFLPNATTVPTTNPTGGGILYTESGQPKWRDTSGVVTTLTAGGGTGGVQNPEPNAVVFNDDLSVQGVLTAGSDSHPSLTNYQYLKAMIYNPTQFYVNALLACKVTSGYCGADFGFGVVNASNVISNYYSYGFDVTDIADTTTRAFWLYDTPGGQYPFVMMPDTVAVGDLGGDRVAIPHLAKFQVMNTDPAKKLLVVRGATGQTANLQEWQNNAGTTLTSVKADGTIVVSAIATPTAATGQLYYDSTRNAMSVGVGSTAANIPLTGAVSVNVTAVTVNAASSVTAQNLMSYSVPAGLLNVARKTMRLFGAGVLSINTSSSVSIKVNLGGVTLVTWTTAVITGGAGTANSPWNFDLILATVATGTSGTVEAHGIWNLKPTTGMGSVTSYIDGNTAASAAINLTTAQTLQVTVTFNANGAGGNANACTQRMFHAELSN